MYKNLFSTWYNSILTIISLSLVFFAVRGMLSWLINEAQWEVIQVNFRLLMVGQYPVDLIWRVWLCLHLLAAVIGLSWGVWVRGRWIQLFLLVSIPLSLSFLPGIDQSARWHLLSLSVIVLGGYFLGRVGGRPLGRLVVNLWVLYFILVILVIRGFTLSEGWFRIVPSNLWGGLLLTFLLTVTGIVFSFPLGILLALGRRSRLPAVRGICITYIEVIRGVPLVTILFMAQVMLPFFLSTGTPPDRVLRAIAGITLFSAAYLAENVRGGLQAVPQGQYEAAYAVGLSGFKTMIYIILPQALRTVIPVLVGQFISLFKDTTLVSIVGLLDLLGISRSILAQPQYIAQQREVLLFITAIYWVFSYLMAYVSQRLEISLGVGER
ncbi:MAG: amino acid ABC transporter permease [Chloroflexi bacterium RBG_16_54_18]|nr:MAG: amino acid ABC transporter permease [Chloroflexi bacterium RBG_16_54_18]